MTEREIQDMGNRMMNLSLRLIQGGPWSISERMFESKQLSEDAHQLLNLAPFIVNIAPPK